MNRLFHKSIFIVALVAIYGLSPSAIAQHMQHDMQMPAAKKPVAPVKKQSQQEKTAPTEKSAAPAGEHAMEPNGVDSDAEGHRGAKMKMDEAPAQDTADMDGTAQNDSMAMGAGPHEEMGMKGALGSYSMMRDASGTSWQPESTPMQGVHADLGDDWSAMFHGYALGIYDHQGGPRGDNKAFSESMFMGMAQHALGAGQLTFRGMLSFDPAMGKDGYPLLLQTGETGDGVNGLIDRQHPHDFLMELAAVYSHPIDENSSFFLYGGLPGEPALGPPAFMHRFSGMDNPAAPISHHWLDSTHITFGVITAGYVNGPWKIEGSAFNGREPDERRWNFDEPRLDSGSTRLSFNPSENWALQVSYGFLNSPEQLHPNVDQHRLTASASYNQPFDNGNWQTTLAWGRNFNRPGNNLDAFLLESAVTFKEHTVFARFENTEKDELFPATHPLDHVKFNVSAFTLGYVYDIPVADHFSLGLGASGSIYALPDTLKPFYGSSPKSYMLFARLKLK